MSAIITWAIIIYLVYRYKKKKKEDEETRKAQEKINVIRENQGLKPVRNSQSREDLPTSEEYQSHYRDYGHEKGELGEWLIEYALKTIEGRRFILKNVYIPYRNSTSEIDLILLHEKGIYVFESKNYGGWIFGSIGQQYWTQTFNKNTKYKFYNPIMQNKTHIEAVRACLGLSPSNPIKSFIVFSERSELKKVPASTENIKICQKGQMMDLLRQDLENRPTVYELTRLDDFKNKLHKYTLVTEEEKAAHIEQANKHKKGSH